MKTVFHLQDLNPSRGALSGAGFVVSRVNLKESHVNLPELRNDHVTISNLRFGHSPCQYLFEIPMLSYVTIMHKQSRVALSI